MSNQGFILFGFVISTMTGVALWIRILRRVSFVSRAYQTVAEKWDGKYERLSFVSPGRLCISHANAKFVLQTFLQWKGGRFTKLCVSWPDAETRLECRRRSTRDWLLCLISRPLRTGQREFDSRLLVFGSPPERIDGLLSGGVQSAMLRINKSQFDRRIEFRIRRGKLTLLVDGFLREHHRIDSLLREFCDLYEQLMLVDSLDIEFFAQELGADLPSPICRVCGEEILTAAVACRRCDTLHHRECWRYFGKCSVYACGEWRSRRAKLATTPKTQLCSTSAIDRLKGSLRWLR